MALDASFGPHQNVCTPPAVAPGEQQERRIAEEHYHRCGGTEGGDLALRIDDRLFRAGVDGAAGAEAGGDDARARVAGADGAHHVVAAAGADEDAGVQAEPLRLRRLQQCRRAGR